MFTLPERSVAPAFTPQNTLTNPEPLPPVGDTVSHEPFPDADQTPP